MGLRFRKSFKLAPGVRLNWGLSGPSFTIGPRGASVNFGQKGTYANFGIPGTGLAFRESLGSSRRSQRSTRGSQQIEFVAKLSIQDDGTVKLSDGEGNPFSPQLEAKLRKQNSEVIRGRLAVWCNDRNKQIEQLETIHLKTPAPDQKPKYVPGTFEKLPPISPPPLDFGLWGLLLPWVRKRRERDYVQRIDSHRIELTNWKKGKADFEKRESERKLLLEERLYSDQEAMHSVFEERLLNIQWPRETNVSMELSPDSKTVHLDVDLPEIEDVPKQTVSLTATGMRVSFKALSETNRRSLYMRHVHAIGFRLLGETFASLPTVEFAVLSAYSQRPDTTTGSIKDDYLYSVKVSREEFGKIHFDKLANIDAVDCLASFELRREMTKTGVFKPIEPYASNS